MNGGAAAAVGESDVSGGQTTGCKAYLINTVHDSVWLDVHRSVAPQVISAVKAVMEAAPQTLTKLFPHLMFDVPMPVTVKAGPTLGDMSEDSVPLSTSEAVQ
jgi:DNA polymerase I-like protein with 3'-5' exonuclease and polymerase domains